MDPTHECSDDNADEDHDTAEIVEGIMKLASLVINERNNFGDIKTSDNEMEFIFDELVETTKIHGYLQTRDCSGAFEDAVALTDAASSILRTNCNLKGKSTQKKQISSPQTDIIPFAAKKKKTDK